LTLQFGGGIGRRKIYAVNKRERDEKKGVQIKEREAGSTFGGKGSGR